MAIKILMLNNEYPPLGGGTGTVNKEILERLVLYPDLKIDLITGWQGKGTKIENIGKNIRIIKLGLNNKNIHHASNFELVLYTLKAFFFSIRLQKKEKYDFSFAWSTIPAGFVSFLLFVFQKLPFIVRVGGPDIPGFEDRYKNIYKIISPIIKLVWKKSKLVISKCQTEYDMIYAINKKLPLKIIYNGVDSDKFTAKLYSDKEVYTIICPARLIKRKGQDILIKAIGKLKQYGIIINCNLVGEGDEKGNYLNLTKELGVQEQINFKSYIPREDMVKEYHAADLFILPSYNEGMSNALLEAMACGLPVVVTDVGGTTELVEEGENGYIFKAGSVNQLFTILKNIIENPQNLRELGERSRIKGIELNWDFIIEKYHKLLRNTI